MQLQASSSQLHWKEFYELLQPATAYADDERTPGNTEITYRITKLNKQGHSHIP